jgi:hypothetical protein
VAFVSIGHLTWLAAATLFTTAVVGGSGYLIRELHRQIRVACSVAGLPAPAFEPSSSIIATAEMLDVTSIALGRAPVAVVNGEVITEGASLQLQTNAGKAILRVISIRDGLVKFRCGDQIIAANLRRESSAKARAK